MNWISFTLMIFLMLRVSYGGEYCWGTVRYPPGPGGKRAGVFAPEPSRKPGTSQLTDIYPQTTICIDDLDEVKTKSRPSLLKAFKNVFEKLRNLVKIFVTSWMDIDIFRQFETFPRIELRPDDNIGSSTSL